MITTPHRPTPERQTPERPTTECIHLSGISWQTYESLLQELGDRRLRLTYYRGDLEIMSPSPERELSKEVLGRFVETLAEETDLQIYPLGSTTLKRAEGESGAEPDKCFYVKGIAAVRGKKRLDLTTDPAPDFVIEIDVTSSSQTRLQVYADLGVAEVWVYAETALTVYQLSGDRYQKTTESQFFPNIPIAEIAIFLQQSVTTDYLDLVKQFRGWVRSQLNSQ
jgi:Uma2 family endonuclease